MNTHTPGPWSVQTIETNHHGYDWPTFAIRSHANNCLACVGDVDRATAEHNTANARLIAASPDLLSALQALTQWGRDHLSPVHEPDTLPLLVAAHAAIAKATNTQPPTR